MKLAPFVMFVCLASVCFGQSTPEQKPATSDPAKTDQGSATAASKPAVLAGTLVDNAGAVINGATVILRETGGSNNSDHDSKRGVSDQDGKFSFEQIRPGLYQLDLSKPEFKTAHIGQIEVLGGKTTAIKVALATKKGVDVCVDCDGSLVRIDPTSTSIQTTTDAAEAEKIPHYRGLEGLISGP
jgi:protocatechuate 3,4-dioxygenase beta subunit